MEYSKQYAFYILLSAPIMCMSFVLNNVLRAEGKAVLSMIGLVVGAVVNVGLDPILIFGFGMGVRGAAIATFVSIYIFDMGQAVILMIHGKTMKSIAK